MARVTLDLNKYVMTEAQEINRNNGRRALWDIVKQIPEFTFSEGRQEYVNRVLQDTPQEIRTLVKTMLDVLLIGMYHIEASDIDLGGHGCKGKIWYRVHGNKQPDTETESLSLTESDVLIQNILSEKDRLDLLSNRFVDFSYSLPFEDSHLRFRGTIYFELNHLALNMRLVNSEIRTIQSLNFHPNVVKLLSLQYVKRGLVLVTGITGSGKSTTLDTIIDANNRTNKGHIVIIANPIEYVHQPKIAIVRHREIGRDVTTFKEGTIQALRQDPDIVVIGEMRDSDTISTVLEVADSGHKVFTTLHTSSTTEAVDRILGETPATEQVRIRERLADVLTCVISQKLVPSLDGRRVLAKEVLVATASVRAAIRNSHTDEIYQLIYQGGQYGMITMEQDLVNLCKNKIISENEAHNNANNKKRFDDLLKLR